jgi:uncharacterized protein YjbI with pentapeptide repeats
MADSKHLEVARAGTSAWNTWRLAHPSDHADFSGTDFTSAENRDIVFSGFEFGESANFNDTRFGDTPIGYQIYGVDPNRGSPSGAALFHGAVFGGDASFHRAKFGTEARFDGAVFEGSANFLDARFAGPSRFTGAVFGSVTFDGARFGNYTWFDGVLFVDHASFERTVFGEVARFDSAAFGTAYFSYSAFGPRPVFDDAFFADRVQFEYATVGDYAWFRGAAFEAGAWFDATEFGGGASFEARDERAFNAAATEKAKLLPERYRELYLNRARAANPSAFQRISFSWARFCSEDPGRSTGESLILRIVRWPQRLLRWSPVPGGSHSSGASFRGRTLHSVCDFSMARFDQPPDFGDIQQADNLDLGGTTFSFRASVWPRWRYWTTQTETVTRLRRLRALADEIHAVDAERDFFIMERMAERGIAWSVWRANVLRPWDFHQLMRATPVQGARRVWRRGLDWSHRTATSVWFALRGVGRPAELTVLSIPYHVSSDFGRSVALPTGWVVISQFAFAFWYSRYITGGMSWHNAVALTTFTLANAIPFVGVSRKAFDSSADVLFTSIPEGVHAIALVHGIVSAVLLFLIIFALRYHFRIR